MISGFNTDIKWDGTTYHVQTEDKGLKTPFVLSLVYQGGTILASKRSPYDDLVEKGFDELELEERVQRQHKLICAAIRAGRIEDLKRMSLKDPMKQAEGLVVRKPEKPKTQTPVQEVPKSHTAELQVEDSVIDEDPITLDVPEPSKPKAQEPPVPSGNLDPIPRPPNRLTAELKAREVRDREFESTPIERPADPEILPTQDVSPESAADPTSFDQEAPEASSEVPNIERNADTTMPESVPETIYDIPMVEDVEIVESSGPGGEVVVEEEFVLPADAVKVLGELDAIEPAIQDELKVKILGSEEFESGDRKNVNVLVFRGSDEQAVAGAGIMVKVLGSDFRPQIFHAVADSNGVAVVSVAIPDFRSGRAAVLVRAMVGNEEAEIRRAIQLKDY